MRFPWRSLQEQRILAVRLPVPAGEWIHIRWNCPSGIVDAGETPAEAAGRATLEEMVTPGGTPIEVLGPTLPDNPAGDQQRGNCQQPAECGVWIGRSSLQLGKRGSLQLHDPPTWPALLLEASSHDSLHVPLLLLATLRGVLRLP